MITFDDDDSIINSEVRTLDAKGVASSSLSLTIISDSAGEAKLDSTSTI